MKAANVHQMHQTFKNGKLAQNMKSQDHLWGTSLEKDHLDVILRFTCNSSTHRAAKYKCVAVYYFNVIMRKIPENVIRHERVVVQTVTTEIQNKTGTLQCKWGRRKRKHKSHCNYNWKKNLQKIIEKHLCNHTNFCETAKIWYWKHTEINGH